MNRARPWWTKSRGRSDFLAMHNSQCREAMLILGKTTVKTLRLAERRSTRE